VRINAAELERLPKDVQRKITEKLAELDRVHELNPLQRFHPMPPKEDEERSAQTAYLEAQPPTCRTKMLAAGNQYGKTTVGVVDDLIQAVDRECLPEHLRRFKWCEPPFFGRVIAPSYKLLDTVQLVEFKQWCPAAQLYQGKWDKAFQKQNYILQFANGSMIDFFTYETDLDKFGGVKRHRIRFDEEPGGEAGRQIYLESRIRLTRFAPMSQIAFTMTPLMGIGWAMDEVWEERGKNGVVGIQASVFDNVHLDQSEVAAQFAGLSKEEYAARVKGEFVAFQGKVFDEFSDAEHVVKTPDREHVRGQEVVVGIDPGIRFTGVSFIAFDSDNSALVFDELLLTDHPVPQVCERIKAKCAEWGVSPIFVIDPSARNRSAVNAEQVEAVYAREGIHCAPGQNAVEAGVFEVKRRLQNGMFFVAENCERLRWEINRYRIQKTPDGSFAVVKESDHVIDSTRYGLMFRPYNLAQPVHERRRPGWIPNVEQAWHGRAPSEPASPLGSFS
jgi:hypothetical protein